MRGQSLQEGCIDAGFGIDADNLSNISMFGDDACNPCSADDWFEITSAFPGSGIGIIDTTGGSAVRTLLLGGSNVTHIAGMSVPPNSLINGNRFIDGNYIRDFYGGTGATDLTSYTNASKNGEDPADWNTGSSNVTGKNDIIDCYAHLRRDGPSFATNDLWLMVAFSRVSNSGSSYFDAEIYAKDIGYNYTTNSFTSAGTEEGHTAWQFDGSGNILSAGDMILSVNLSTNSAPQFQLRIWVSRNDYNTLTPTNFSFGANFDGDNNSSVYGYADITPPNN
ncbi:MAG: hypothetical protein AAFO94_21110, partial [Bacteroidota bacterium]